MSIILYTDNASSLLASGIGTSDTTLTVTATQGSLFPAPGAGQKAIITLESVGGAIEIVSCTGRTGDTMTIVRGQEGTTPTAFASGSRVELRVTAGSLQAYLQKTGGDTLSGTTTVSGILALGSGGSIQGGEYAGGFLRSGAGVTAGQLFVSSGSAFSGTSLLITQANMASNLPNGTDLCRTGMILFWNGSTLDVPAGWHICDGTVGTPDLRDVFIVGGAGSFPTSGNYTAPVGSTTPGASTSAGYAMTLGDMISHVHPFDYFFGNSAAPIGQPGFTAPANFFQGLAGTGVRNAFAGSPNTGAGTNAHTHSVPGVAHVHTQSIPYKALFMIMKL